VFESEVDKFGTEIKTVNKGIGKRWIIQPKFETPMMNFNDTGLRKVTADAGTLTIPTFGSASVPRGMWHQFGMIESDPDKGIFIEIDDIPENWLKNHYDVVKYNSAYNNDDAEANGALVYKKMKSLSDLVGFTKNTRSARLGELSETQTLLEAVVAIPYIIDVSGVTDVTSISSTQRSSMKKFFEIPEERLTAAQSESDGSEIGDSMDAAGASIRKLIQKMERYILPPQFDFLNNDSVTPIVMYMFEFEYKLDKDDLSYIWQNLAPRNYKDMSMEVQSVAHELIDAELLNESNLMDNENLRWMVFKVKQRSQIDYYDNIIEQINRTNDTAAKLAVSKTISNKSQTGKFGKRSVDGTDDYLLNFNWPYDYVSFVEMVKMDAEVLYKGESDDSGKSAQERNAASAREQVMSDLQSGPSAALSSNKTSSRSKGVRTASSSGRKSLKSTSSRSSSTPSRKSKSATKNRGGLK
jgi:hypothetical protein